MRILAIIFFISALWHTTNAYSDCVIKYWELDSGMTVMFNSSTNYPPYGYTSCQFTVSAPIYHEMVVSCGYSVGVQTSTCDVGNSLQILTDGTTNFNRGTAMRFCGQSSFSGLVAPYNSVTIAFVPRTSGGYSCNIYARPKSECDCGQRNTARIVGGQTAQTNQFPYMAAILEVIPPSFILRGGATIISTNVVLCAAHEVWKNGAKMTPNTIVVSVGRQNLKMALADDSPYAANYTVDQIISHPQYDPNTGVNDIAVILVKPNIRFSRGVNVLCLPASSELQNKYDGQILRALGYGASDYGTDNTYYLKYVDVPAISNSQCSAYYGNSLAITAQDLCHSSSATADTCQGDSGGPIFRAIYRDILVGMVKTGPVCGTKAPGVCQRVSPYIDTFIMKVSPTKNYYCRYE